MSKTLLQDEITKRILVLDGGFGTMVQGYNLCENDYRGEQFASWPTPLKGCNDLLVMTAPHIVGEIHERYLEAGADIVETCSFNANAISLADYGLADYAYPMAKQRPKWPVLPPINTRPPSTRALWPAQWAPPTAPRPSPRI